MIDEEGPEEADAWADRLHMERWLNEWIPYLDLPFLWMLNLQVTKEARVKPVALEKRERRGSLVVMDLMGCRVREVCQETQDLQDPMERMVQLECMVLEDLR